MKKTKKDYDRFKKWMESPLKDIPLEELEWCAKQDEFNSLTSRTVWLKEIERRKYPYTLHLTERQAKLLSYACDRLSRIICGQDWTYQEFMEEAWEKRAKEATGNATDKEWDGGWWNMREDAKAFAKQIKLRFWGLEACAMYGVHYDDVADILFDLHQVIRHQLWLDRPDDQKSPYTVDADKGVQFGSEPFAKIERVEK